MTFSFVLVLVLCLFSSTCGFGGVAAAERGFVKQQPFLTKH